MKHETIYIFIGLLLLSGHYSYSQDVKEKKNLIGKRFPSMTVETLSEKTVQYPDSLMGTVTLILIAFERETQGKIDTWLLPFSEKYGKTEDVSFYEIPMIKRRWIFMAPIIDRGMRGGIDEAKHDHVTTYYGNIDRYTAPLQISDTSDAYAFLLDKNGVIQWHSSGRATQEKLTALYEKTEILR